MKQKLRLFFIVLLVGLVAPFQVQAEFMTTLPITNLPGDSLYPSNTDPAHPEDYEIARQSGENRTWYSVVWAGLYGVNPYLLWPGLGKGTGAHSGMDIRVSTGTVVSAIADGVVARSVDNATWGGLIVIEHENNVDSGKYYSVYAHLSNRNVSANDSITKGQVIGLSGNTGSGSHGAHLHFQIDRNLDPTSAYWVPGYSSANESNITPAMIQAVRNNTFDPVVFALGVGHFSDGWHYMNNPSGQNRSQWIADVYPRFSPWLGLPADNGGTEFVHILARDPGLPDLYAQDFDIGIIVCNDTLQQAFAIVKGFHWVYLNGQYVNPDSSIVQIWGPNVLGAPKSNEVFEYDVSGTVTRQYFEYGRLTYINNGAQGQQGTILVEIGNYDVPANAIEIAVAVFDDYGSGGDLPGDLTGYGGGPPPTSSVNLTATGVDDNTICLGWDTNLDLSNYSFIRIWKGTYPLEVEYDVNSTGYCYGGMGAGSMGCFQVGYFQANGDSIISDEVCAATTLNGQVVDIPKVGNLHIESVSFNEIVGAWAPVSSATRYQVSRNNPSYTWYSLTDPQFVDRGVDPLGHYCYSVKACNSSICGEALQICADTPAAVPPDANFTASVTSGPAPLTVQFTNTSTGVITSHMWAFDDGGFSFDKDVEHTFINPGTYSVWYEAYSEAGRDTKTMAITVTEEPTPNPPTADFTATVTSGYAPLAVQFTDTSSGEVSGWSWNFGDGGTSTQANPSHTYNAVGTYTVTLTASGSGGSDDLVIVNYITVTEEPPVIEPLDSNWWADGGTLDYQNTAVEFHITSQPAHIWDKLWGKDLGVESGQTLRLRFTARAENYSGAGMGIEVEVNDGGPNWDYLANVEDRTITGTATDYVIDLNVTVTDSTASLAINVGFNTGDLYFTNIYLEVLDESPPPPSAPAANFTASIISGYAPLVVQFYDSSDGDVSGWSWNFGDGGTSTQANPSHTYSASGTYEVSLTVSGPGGSDAEVKTGYITVASEPNPDPPTAAFSASATSGYAPLSVQFTDNSNGERDSWSWNFGDGSSSTAQNPSHTYTAAGTYTVSLTATGPGGSDDKVMTGYISVTEESPPPVVPLDGSWWVDGGTMDAQNASVNFHITSVPAHPWSKMWGKDLAVTNGRIYRLHFKARALNYTGGGMPIGIYIDDAGPNYNTLTNEENRTATSTETEFVIDLTASASDSTAALGIDCGYAKGDLYFTEISLEVIIP